MDPRCFIFLAIQFSMLLLGLASSPLSLCHENERSALLEFKKTFFNKSSLSCSFPGAYFNIESWSLEEGSGNCCSWDGIECDKDNGHVIGIDLTDNCLKGNINSNTTLFHLVHLQRLNLAQNSLSLSHISPSATANLSHLTNLDLSYCGLYGQFPSEILKLSNLSSLNMSGNYDLYGQFPPEILKLSNLSSLDMSGNYGLELRKPNLHDLMQKLTKLKNLSLSRVNISDAIPNIISSFLSMRSLKLDDCDLQGEFPQAIFKMPNLEVLDVSYNYHLSGYLPEFNWSSSLKSLDILETNFFGHLPPSLGNLASLNELILSGCNFLGQIPSSIGNLTQLTIISLSNNQLTGEIPSSIGKLSNLKGLNLGSNKLVGEVPSSFLNLTQLMSLDLHLNQLSGQIVPHLTKLIHLYDIDLSFNNFSGPIPSSFTKLKNLVYLDLYSNKLKGIVHLSMFLKLQYLVKLQLSFNQLSLVDDLNNTNDILTNLYFLGLASCNLSSFPTFLQHLSDLKWVDLSHNTIYGEIPEWFLNMTTWSLQTLNLSNNLLTSSPYEPLNFRWKGLRTMDLRGNNLEGSLPIPPTYIEFYLVSGNKLFGELPPQICEMRHISGLELGENNLTGILPQCLNNLSGTLLFLSFRGNNFYGEIHSLLPNGDCNLRMLDLSGNHFQGSLPRSLARCYKLEFLNIGSNQIDDVFPSWLGSLRSSQVLILHSNEFHGPIGEPKLSDDFAALQIIDLSSNNFSSCLPSKP